VGVKYLIVIWGAVIVLFLASCEVPPRVANPMEAMEACFTTCKEAGGVPNWRWIIWVGHYCECFSAPRRGNEGD